MGNHAISYSYVCFVIIILVIISDNVIQFKIYLKKSLDHCILWSHRVPSFIRQGRQTKIRHNTINDRYSLYDASERFTNSWMDIEVELDF